MKKIFALLALVLGVVSCQTEPEGLDVNVGGEQEVMLTVSLPETTRADSANGFDLNSLATTDYSLRYILEVYLGDNCQRHVLVSDNTSVAFPVRLAPDRNYQLVVWADIVEGNSEADRYYNTTNGLDEVTIIESDEIKWNAMNETRDAFTATKPVSAQDIATGAIEMKLKRPFAKLRVVATDYEDVVELGLKPATATVVYSQDMPRTYNALTGAVSDADDKSHNNITYPATPVYNDATGEYTLFADYFFVPESGTAKFQFNVYADAEGTNLIKATNFNTDIYVAANKLTTIKGDVLTTGANINIGIEENGEFDELETYTYVNSGADLIKAINNNGKSILGNDITVNEGDIALAGRLAATRSTDPKSVINLNGFTITVNNTSNTPLVTLNNGETLVFAGAGNIVMTSESTAPFVNTDTNNAIVIIEQATVTNESNQGAAVVDGDAIVNAAANVEEDAVSGDVKPQLEYVLANGGEVTLFQDVTSDKILEISATNPVVINGNGKTISFTYNRGFRITASNNVTIENATIVNNVNGGRCIETRTGGINLTLNNVDLTATNGASQPFTVGGEGENITVNINNSTITSGNGGYGIMTFNPVALNINNSTVSGYAAVYVKSANSSKGSNGSEINVIHSELIGTNNNAGETNAFATVVLEDSNITINVDDNSTIKANANQNYQFAFGFFGRKTPNNEFIETVEGCKVTVATNSAVTVSGDEGKYVFCSGEQATLGSNVVELPATYAEALQAEGWIVSEPTDGLVTVTSAVAKVNGNGYASFEAAVAAAEAGDTIELLNDVTLAESLTLPAGITLDGNGYQINGSINAGGNLTFVDHTKVTSFSASYYDRIITIGEGACLEVTGTGRVTLGYRNTFNITGSVEDAKTADKTNIQPSLIIPGGISITGSDNAEMNVTNAYVQIGDTSSKNSVANGTFTLNFTNAIAEFTHQFTFAEPTSGKTPEFEMNITNSVFTTATKLCIAAPGSVVNVNNSDVILGNYLRNSGELNLTNGSVLTGKTIQFGENGGNDGTITVDYSTFTIIAGSTGHAFDGKGTGSISAINGAEVTVDYYQDMTINVDETSTFTGTDRYANRKIYYVSDEMALEPTNPDALNAKVVSNVWDKTTGKGVITFDSDLTTIGEKAFQRLTNTTPSNWITSITLPESVKTIGNYAFAQCYSLTTINIPDSVESIGQYAFQSCDAVTSVTIGSGVKSIGSGAFYNCYEIKEIICESTTAPALADKWVFNGVDKTATVYVPAASVDTYKAAEFWSVFTNIVVGK